MSAFCLKPITFVPQQTEKRYILEELLKLSVTANSLAEFKQSLARIQ